ncbi:hypothetical protein RF55_10285, partial [Lasius niger]
MLAILFRLGHFAGQSKLIEMAGAIVVKRQADPRQHEEDYGGHIANFLVNFRRNPLTGSPLNVCAVAPIRGRRRPAEEELEAGPSRRARILSPVPENREIPVITISDDDDADDDDVAAENAIREIPVITVSDEDDNDDDDDVAGEDNSARAVSTPDSEIFSP